MKPWKAIFRGEAKATITSHGRGSDVGLQVLSATGAALLIGGAVLSRWVHWSVAAVLMVAGVLILGTVVFIWARLAKERDDRASGALTLYNEHGALTLDSANLRQDFVMQILQSVLQGRQELPEPYGRVEGSPSNVQSLKQLTPGERAEALEAFKRLEQEHDGKVLETLRQHGVQSEDDLRRLLPQPPPPPNRNQ